jgi:hypothetical protein
MEFMTLVKVVGEILVAMGSIFIVAHTIYGFFQ